LNFSEEKIRQRYSYIRRVVKKKRSQAASTGILSSQEDELDVTTLPSELGADSGDKVSEAWKASSMVSSSSEDIVIPVITASSAMKSSSSDDAVLVVTASPAMESSGSEDIVIPVITASSAADLSSILPTGGVCWSPSTKNLYLPRSPIPVPAEFEDSVEDIDIPLSTEVTYYTPLSAAENNVLDTFLNNPSETKKYFLENCTIKVDDLKDFLSDNANEKIIDAFFHVLNEMETKRGKKCIGRHILIFLSPAKTAKAIDTYKFYYNLWLGVNRIVLVYQYRQNSDSQVQFAIYYICSLL